MCIFFSLLDSISFKYDLMMIIIIHLDSFWTFDHFLLHFFIINVIHCVWFSLNIWNFIKIEYITHMAHTFDISTIIFHIHTAADAPRVMFLKNLYNFYSYFSKIIAWWMSITWRWKLSWNMKSISGGKASLKRVVGKFVLTFMLIKLI